MNPLLYKAHPLLYLTVDLLAHPAAHSLREAGRLLAVYLSVNLVFAFGLQWGAKKATDTAPSYPVAYLLALPALLFYLPTMLTLLGDVLAHTFHFTDRLILVFCVFTATQMVGAFYAVAIRHPRNGGVVGLRDGLAISLLMWLVSLPISLALAMLKWDELLKVD